MTKSTDAETLLQFTPDELGLNRQGKLSPGQIARMQVTARAQRVYYLLLLGFVAILLVVIDLVFSLNVQPALSFVMTTATTIILLVGAGFVVYVSARTQRNLAQGSRSSVSGKVTAVQY